jgi:hypothetical protein
VKDRLLDNNNEGKPLIIEPSLLGNCPETSVKLVIDFAEDFAQACEKEWHQPAANLE